MGSLVYLVLALVAAASAAPESRIVGGTPTSIEEFPYIVALMYTYVGPGITVQRCVGSIVSSWHVLTTGFCYTGAIEQNMKIRAGTTNSLSGGMLVEIASVVKHPGYLETPRNDDLAVVFVATPLGLSSVIGVLFLPPQNTVIPDGHEVKVVSWGFEYEGGPQLELLKTITLEKLGFDDCVARYADYDNVVVTDKVICAQAPGRGMCMGDSGAPMVIGQVAVGLSSFYKSCEDDYPDLFTRIDRYTNWILEIAATPGRDQISSDASIRSMPAVRV